MRRAKDLGRPKHVRSNSIMSLPLQCPSSSPCQHPLMAGGGHNSKLLHHSTISSHLIPWVSRSSDSHRHFWATCQTVRGRTRSCTQQPAVKSPDNIRECITTKLPPTFEDLSPAQQQIRMGSGELYLTRFSESANATLK